MPRSKDGGGFSGPLSVIAVVGIALGVTVMVMAVSILRGFQQDITDKVVGFGSHMTVCSYDRLHAYAETPIEVDSVLIDSLRATQGVRHVQAFATKGGMAHIAKRTHRTVHATRHERFCFCKQLFAQRVIHITTPLRYAQRAAGTG